MTPEEIIALTLAKGEGFGGCDFESLKDEAIEEYEPGATRMKAALAAAGYEIRKADPSMVYVPRKPTEEMVCAVEGGIVGSPDPISAARTAYRAMISAVEEGQREMATVSFTGTLEYDADLMHGDDADAVLWFFNEILRDQSGNLHLFSEEIGDMIGTVTLDMVRRNGTK